MDANKHSSISEPLHTSCIPIAQLSPTLELSSDHSIHASVILIWPYSSSTKSLSLLLAEPDFRLRYSNGQVKVVFHGHIAESVARSQVGIGDSVYLSLAGVRFLNSVAAIGTPGKSVTWDVHFDDRVFLEIWRSSEHLSTVKVDPPPSPLADNDITIAPPATPIANGYHNDSAGGLESWQSPAFLGRSRTFLGGLADSVFDPFVEEDGFVPGKGRKRPRFSMRSSEWRVIDEPESPGERREVPDWTHIFDDDGGSESDHSLEGTAEKGETPLETVEIKGTSTDSEDVSFAMATSKADITIEEASLESSGTIPERHTGQAPDEIMFPPAGVSRVAEFSRTSSKRGALGYPAHLPIETPRLHPIPSPGLPIPSPLVTMANSPQGYFTPAAATTHSYTSQIPSTLSQEVTESDNEITDAQPSTSQTLGFEGTAITSETEGPEPRPGSNTTRAIHQTTGQLYSLTSTTVADTLPNKISEVAAEPTQGDQTESHTEKAHGHLGEIDRLESSKEEGKDVKGFIVDETRNRAQEEDEFEKHKGETHQKTEMVTEDDLKDDERKPQLTKEGNCTEGSRTDNVAEGVDYGTGEGEEEDAEKSERLRHYHALTAESDDEPIEESHGSFIEAGSEEEDERNEKWSENEAKEEPEEDVREEVEEDEESGDEQEQEQEAEDEENAGSEGIEGDEVEVEWGDEEEWYEEEEEEAEDLYDDEDDKSAESEDESDQMSVDTSAQPPAPRDVYPEIIVLDSDSTPEATPAPQTYLMSSSRQEISARMVESSDDETSASEDDSLGSGRSDNSEGSEDEEGEDWSEENSGDEQLGEDDMEHATVDNKYQEAEQAADEQLYTGRTRNEKVDKGLVEWGGYQRGNKAIEEPPEIKNDQVSISSSTKIKEVGSDTDQQQIPQETHTINAPSEDLEQDGLESLSNSTPFSQRPQSGSRAALHGLEMLIDPELQNMDLDGEQASREGEEEPHPDPTHAEVGTREFSRIPERGQSIDYPLFLDGSSSLQASHDSPGVLPGRPSTEQHFLTMNGSQGVEIDQRSSTDFTAVGITPTFEHTQERTTQHHQGKMSSAVRVEVPALAQQNVSITEDVEHEACLVPILQEGQHEVERFSGHRDAGSSESPDEDQAQEVALYSDEDSAEDLDQTHVAGVDRHYPGLRSKHSYFAPLATIFDHYNALVDTISVVSDVQPVFRTASGKRDFILTLQLTDPSMVGTTLYAQIFQPFKAALPSVEEGNAILLRNFKAKRFNHSVMLASDATSSWAVFNGSDTKPLIDGPPVEYGSEEQACATDLRQWYQEAGMAMVADNQLQASIDRESREGTPASSAAFSDSGSIDSTLRDVRSELSLSSRGSRRGKRSHRRITIHELRDGKRYTEVGSPSGKESIHELRDGTVYANL
ncbi:hypothetical protein BDV28DRAFT_24256 [Aspergillus coremiiformis]|uniref:Telomeric single stranded DNA binding POT1/Cdc13 domain-containing protein n=1 Tax=Aspergillus coremiiformis TaxID=138285 RepID=A0A5N6ZI25_9EURO|nr:hypothetical protein BDV28DRAFT_24256 [Aspergillus coremiiformis]